MTERITAYFIRKGATAFQNAGWLREGSTDSLMDNAPIVARKASLAISGFRTVRAGDSLIYRENAVQDFPYSHARMPPRWIQ